MIETYYRKNGFIVPGDVKFGRFPGGDQHIFDAPDYEPLVAIWRGTDANDLVDLAMWVDMVGQNDHEAVVAIPYLPGARQDRGMPEGAYVYAKLIQSMNPNAIIVFDPHSGVIIEHLDGPGRSKPEIIEYPLARLVRNAVSFRRAGEWYHPYDAVIAPDKGATERAKAVADALHVPVVQGYKHRDFKTGKLSGFSCDPVSLDKRYLIVDDICDGGGTFMGLVDSTGLKPENVDLWVTHGIFSATPAKTMDLIDTFGAVFTTDSHPGARAWEDEIIITSLDSIIINEAIAWKDKND